MTEKEYFRQKVPQMRETAEQFPPQKGYIYGKKNSRYRA